jgi:excinuclease UvrABC nuclease subunit
MALRRCGIYKFWALKGMRAQVRLLQMLVNYSDPDTEAFNLDGKPLRIEVKDIYFLKGLSCRGEVVNFKSMGAKSGMNI